MRNLSFFFLGYSNLARFEFQMNICQSDHSQIVRHEHKEARD
jgi:hypothetical protein